MSAAAGYSGTPLAGKLGIRAGARVALLGDAGAVAAVAAELPGDVRPLRRAVAPLDVAVLGATSRADLARRLPAVRRALDPAGGLWVAWPKRSSGVATDLTEDVVRELGLAAGLVDNKVCAVDTAWSALRLVVRLRDRPGRS
jgi:hypothetical protein